MSFFFVTLSSFKDKVSFYPFWRIDSISASTRLAPGLSSFCLFEGKALPLFGSIGVDLVALSF